MYFGEIPSKEINPDILLIYDCMNYKCEYLGRISMAVDAEKYKNMSSKEQSDFIRAILDSDEILYHACSWRQKIVSYDLIMDHCEYGEW